MESLYRKKKSLGFLEWGRLYFLTLCKEFPRPYLTLIHLLISSETDP